MQAGQATAQGMVAGQLCRKLLKEFPANDEGLTWARAEWAVSGRGASMGGGVGDVESE